jgi:hypothetical protein
MIHQQKDIDSIINVNSLYWKEELFEGLCEATLCSNFKVKIGACAALSSPSSILQYGSMKIATRCYRAIQILDNEMDRMLNETAFGEYCYKEQLQNVVTESLNHFDKLGVKNENFNRLNKTFEDMSIMDNGPRG